jgi:cytochrome b561
LSLGADDGRPPQAPPTGCSRSVPGPPPTAGSDALGDAATDHAALAATRVAAGDDRTRYDDFAITLHWLTVLPVLTQSALTELRDLAERPTRHVMIVAHMSFGILLTLALIVRVARRLTSGHRVRPATSGRAGLAAEGVHHLLYGLLAAEAVLGFVLRWSGDEAVSFFGLPIPPPFAPFSKPAHHLVGEAHDIVGSTTIVVAAGHAAALFHHFRLHDEADAAGTAGAARGAPGALAGTGGADVAGRRGRRLNRG